MFSADPNQGLNPDHYRRVQSSYRAMARHWKCPPQNSQRRRGWQGRFLAIHRLSQRIEASKDTKYWANAGVCQEEVETKAHRISTSGQQCFSVVSFRQSTGLIASAQETKQSQPCSVVLAITQVYTVRTRCVNGRLSLDNFQQHKTMSLPATLYTVSLCDWKET